MSNMSMADAVVKGTMLATKVFIFNIETFKN